MSETKDAVPAVPHTIAVADLTSWQSLDTALDIDADTSNSGKHATSPFPFDESINNRICIWNGPAERLAVDALVNANTENFTDPSPRTQAILAAAGPRLDNELSTLQQCRTGDVHVTEGGRLPTSCIIHTVSPRYNAKYETAAASALYNCYRNILDIVLERKLRTLGLVTVHNYARDYPLTKGGHLALRVLRRFLEQFSDRIDRIVLICDGFEQEHYRRLLPIYFPRSVEEQSTVLPLVPADIGDHLGAPVIDERGIRIADTLSRSNSDGVAEIHDATFDARAFATMSTDFDKARIRRLQSQAQSNSKAEQDRALYQQYLHAAKHMDSRLLEEREFVRVAGEDHTGARVIVFTGRSFHAVEPHPVQVLQYIISIMDRLVDNSYTVVYLHTMVEGDHRPDTGLFKRLAEVADSRYLSHLSRVFVVHPTWWTKLSAWFVGTFAMPASLREKITYIDHLHQLYDYVTPNNLKLPQFVVDWDQKKFPNEYTGTTTSTPGDL
eukprot:TRINITY_DN10571_c0_g1_i2.p1 TRINITY_DN10571_c0_g1~~TRINITY_DN10571_c0_g1_i2.p1  ORF type:complete len:497 (+),score=64.68 TRINITY_DN10571_c0_g1_i2:59-1549(+)